MELSAWLLNNSVTARAAERSGGYYESWKQRSPWPWSGGLVIINTQLRSSNCTILFQYETVLMKLVWKPKNHL